MSAIRWRNTWLAASGLPNCTRVRVYSRVAASTALIAPSASAHAATQAWSSARAISSAVTASRASSPSSTPSSNSVHARPPSTVSKGCTVTPGVPRGTMNHRWAPAASIALTSHASAASPAATGRLQPCRRQCAPTCTAVVRKIAGANPAPGSKRAGATSASPAAIAGSQRCRCAASPQRAISSAACMIAGMNGALSAPPPKASASTQASASPCPRPPSASGKVMPSQPKPAILRQCETPAAAVRASATHRCALSRSSPCSSLA